MKHCIKGTEGWQIQKDIVALIDEDHVFDKPTFGSVELAKEMKQDYTSLNFVDGKMVNG